MAEEAADSEDRTEAATPQRIERARRDGDAALSRETVQFASLGAGALGLAMLAPQAGRSFAEEAAALLQAAHATTLADATLRLVATVAPLALGGAAAAAAAALAATFLQTRMFMHARGLTPDLSRLNPIAGAKRLLGSHALAEMARTLLKLAAVGLALWWAAGDLDGSVEVIAGDAGALADSISSRVGRLLTATLAAMASVAALDLLWVRFSHARKLRMSRQEMRDEIKESEGDPFLKARRLQVARARSRRRMLDAVPKATVVITNPTHYAVALAYERGRDAAPRITAKGVDAMAARIRAAAETHGVPIVPNPPLARALWRLDHDAEVPEEHFKAVAEIIAFVWRLRTRAP